MGDDWDVIDSDKYWHASKRDAQAAKDAGWRKPRGTVLPMGTRNDDKGQQGQKGEQKVHPYETDGVPGISWWEQIAGLGGDAYGGVRTVGRDMSSGLGTTARNITSGTGGGVMDALGGPTFVYPVLIVIVLGGIYLVVDSKAGVARARRK